MEKSDRILWMDFVRGLCILLVIISHSSSVMGKYGVEVYPAVNLFNKLFSPYRMPTLMFLSGMLVGRSTAKPALSYVDGKFSNIYWPYLLWSLITLAATQQLSNQNLINIFLIPPTYLWYLWFLFSFYLIILIIEKLNISPIPFIFASVIVSYFIPNGYRAPRFFFLLAFFLLGHYIVKNGINLAGRKVIGLAGLAIAVIGAWLSASGVQLLYQVNYIWVPAGLVTFILWSAPHYKTGGAGSILEWIGRNSVIFYVVHLSTQHISLRWWTSHSEPHFWTLFFVMGLSTLIVGTALTFARERSMLVQGLFSFQAWRSFARLRPAKSVE